MIVDGKQIRPIWLDEDGVTVKVIDQRKLPHQFVVADLTTVDQVIHAIQQMFVRGAPLIGVTGAYGVMIAAMNGKGSVDHQAFIDQECRRLKAARPTAVNLAWGVDRVLRKVSGADTEAGRIDASRREAAAIAEEEAENCRQIGVHGAAILEEIARRKKGGDGQRADPLQCRLAGLHRIRHGHRTCL